jgi:hypothetical protein
MHLTCRRIEGQTLEFGIKNSWLLGENLFLSGCRIIIRVRSKNLILNDAEFRNCEVFAPVKQIDSDWTGARFYDCTFRGRFYGCSFGFRPPPAGNNNYGAITDCDFRSAWMLACSFYGCEESSVKLPPWPSFSIIDLERTGLEFAQLDLPEQLRWIFMGPWHPGESIRSFNALWIERYCAVPINELFNLVRDKPYILW